MGLLERVTYVHGLLIPSTRSNFLHFVVAEFNLRKLLGCRSDLIVPDSPMQETARIAILMKTMAFKPVHNVLAQNCNQTITTCHLRSANSRLGDFDTWEMDELALKQ